MEKKLATISFRTEIDVKAKVEDLADERDVTMSRLVERILKAHFEDSSTEEIKTSYERKLDLLCKEQDRKVLDSANQELIRLIREYADIIFDQILGPGKELVHATPEDTIRVNKDQWIQREIESFSLSLAYPTPDFKYTIEG